MQTSQKTFSLLIKLLGRLDVLDQPFYGNEIMLLDATYKTMQYELLLFFLVVKTNVNYVVVDSFVTQNERIASIKEALHIFHDWNPTWQPKFFMTDFCFEEINAIESAFEG